MILRLLGQRCPDWQKLTLWPVAVTAPPTAAVSTWLNHFIQTRIDHGCIAAAERRQEGAEHVEGQIELAPVGFAAKAR